MIKKLSQTALAVTCLIGTIQMDNQPMGYFDEGQSVISSSVSGWSFGLNSAMGCDDFNSCEHVEVIGEPWEDDPVWDDLGYDGGSGGGSGGSDSGNDGGGSNSTPSQEDQRRQCENNAKATYATCARKAESDYAHAMFFHCNEQDAVDVSVGGEGGSINFGFNEYEKCRDRQQALRGLGISMCAETRDTTIATQCN